MIIEIDTGIILLGKAHQGRLDCIAEDISSLQKKHQATKAALEESKRRQLELSHRVLKVLVRQGGYSSNL